MIAVSLIAIAVALPLFCITAERMSAPGYGNGSIVFIEHIRQTHGRLITGTYPAPSLTGMNYLYDAGRRLLEGGDLKTNDSLRVVLGISESLSQDAGSGATGKAYGVCDMPSGAGGITVEGLSPDGTVTLSYNGSKIVLSPGERWETISTEAVSTSEYAILLIRSDLIRNDGFLARSDIS